MPLVPIPPPLYISSTGLMHHPNGRRTFLVDGSLSSLHLLAPYFPTNRAGASNSGNGNISYSTGNPVPQSVTGPCLWEFLNLLSTSLLRISRRTGPGPQTPATAVRFGQVRLRPGHPTIYCRRAKKRHGVDAVHYGLASATAPMSFSFGVAPLCSPPRRVLFRCTPSNRAIVWHRGGAAPISCRSGTRSAPRAESSPETVCPISCRSM